MMMRFFTFFLVLFSILQLSPRGFSQSNWPLQNSLTGIQSLSTFPSSAVKTNFNVTPCGGSTLSLDATVAPEMAPQPTSGSMNNDVWLGFITQATSVKVRVCDPTFDAALEVYRVSDGQFITAINIAGDGDREYGMVNGLEQNMAYAVRVGRYSGSGGGTFSFNVEHFGVATSSNYSPAPPGHSCYLRTLTTQRNTPITTPMGIINHTRWKFVPVPSGSEFTCTSGTNNLPLNGCFAFCSSDLYDVFCEARAIDAECGNVWWGYSFSRPLQICDNVCIGIVDPPNNSSIPFIKNRLFKTGTIGTSSMAQWKFVTNNGATEICSPWVMSTQFLPSSVPAVGNCLEFNKIYQVYVRVRYCADDPIPDWCPNPITVFSQPMPRVEFEDSDCCIWRNKAGIIYPASNGFSFSQYRFRFTPVANTQNPCPSANLAPIGPAIATGWINSAGTTTNYSLIQKGVIYNVQVQARMLPASCTSCSGSSFDMHARYVDWGPPCLMGFRNNNNPAAGTPLSCGCNIGAMALEDWNSEEYESLISHFGTIELSDDEMANAQLSESEEDVELGIYVIEPGKIQVDLSNAAWLGNDLSVRVFDMSGRLLKTETTLSQDEVKSALIQFEGVAPSGILVVSVRGNHGVLNEKIFVAGK